MFESVFLLLFVQLFLVCFHSRNRNTVKEDAREGLRQYPAMAEGKEAIAYYDANGQMKRMANNIYVTMVHGKFKRLLHTRNGSACREDTRARSPDRIGAPGRKVYQMESHYYTLVSEEKGSILKGPMVEYLQWVSCKEQ